MTRALLLAWLHYVILTTLEKTKGMLQFFLLIYLFLVREVILLQQDGDFNKKEKVPKYFPISMFGVSKYNTLIIR